MAIDMDSSVESVLSGLHCSSHPLPLFDERMQADDVPPGNSVYTYRRGNSNINYTKIKFKVKKHTRILRYFTNKLKTPKNMLWFQKYLLLKLVSVSG
jgi:hypothetical protein